MKTKYDDYLMLLNRTESEVFVFILCTDHVAMCFEKNVCIYVNLIFEFKIYKKQKCRQCNFFSPLAFI